MAEAKPLEWLKDRNKLSAQLRKVDEEIADVVEADVKRFAPPALRDKVDTETVTEAFRAKIQTFAELPTKELDKMLAETKQKITRLEEQCQAIRDEYEKKTSLVAEALRVIQEDVDLGNTAVEQLKEKITRRVKPPEN